MGFKVEGLVLGSEATEVSHRRFRSWAHVGTACHLNSQDMALLNRFRSPNSECCSHADAKTTFNSDATYMFAPHLQSGMCYML